MKRCPTCNRTYPDEQAFCMDDGATLVDSSPSSDPGATVAYTGQAGGMPPPQTPPGPQGFGSNAAPGYQPPPPPGMFGPPPGGPSGATTAPNKFQPALIGGLFLGLLSSIPFVNYGNLICCLWVVLGGALTTYLYIKKSAAPVQMGEGAMLGALAGLIGFAVEVIVGIPLRILAGDPLSKALVEWAAQMDPVKGEAALRQYQRLTNAPFMEQLAAAFTPFLLLSLIVVVIFATLGGLVAVPIFEKRKAQQMPPPLPPPDFGGGYR
jgi:hypothetical protein